MVAEIWGELGHIRQSFCTPRNEDHRSVSVTYPGSGATPVDTVWGGLSLVRKGKAEVWVSCVFLRFRPE